MKRHIGSMLGVVLLAQGLSPIASAWRGVDRLERIAERIGVDQPTKARIAQIIGRSRREALSMRERLHGERAKLRRLLQQDLPAERAVLAQVDKVGAQKLALKRLRFQTMLQLRRVLTAAQRQALRELRQRWRDDLRRACRHDSASLCPSGGQARLKMRCLWRHLEELSPVCRHALADRMGGAPGDRF